MNPFPLSFANKERFKKGGKKKRKKNTIDRFRKLLNSIEHSRENLTHDRYRARYTGRSEDENDTQSNESRANYRVDGHCANDSVTSHSCKVPVHFFHRLGLHERAIARVQRAQWCATTDC